MSELNNKPINYGALNRFYQNLKLNDLSKIINYSAGENIQIDGNVINATDTIYSAGSNISINGNNEISCTYQYTLPTASNEILGGVKIGKGLKINNGIISIDINFLKRRYFYDLLPNNEKYLTFEAEEDNTKIIYRQTDFHLSERPIEYSTDLLNWTVASPIYNIQDGVSVLATLNYGECVYIRGNNSNYHSNITEMPLISIAGMQLLCDKNCKCYGNIMSLINSSNFANLTATTDNSAFAYLFCPNAHNGVNCISDISNLVLPATTLTDYCYCGMFKGCTGLTSVPSDMLPATTLASNCYQYMFRDCSSLITAPELPATALTYYSYYGMFSGCTNLNSITMLAENISSEASLYKWVQGVSETGTFIKSAQMTTLPTGVNGIPSGWTVQDYVAPSA